MSNKKHEAGRRFNPAEAVECVDGCGKRTMNDDGVCSVCAYISKYDKGKGKGKSKSKAQHKEKAKPSVLSELPNESPGNGGKPADSHEIPTESQENPPDREKSPSPALDASTQRMQGDTRFPVLSCEAITLTNQKAKKLLKLNTYAAQRTVKKRNLKDLETAMREGRWRSTDISIAVMDDGREILVNGQHTLTACVNTARPIFVIVIRFAVKDEDELSELYRTFDLGRGARSISDAVKAELKACKLEWPLLIASLITSAAACIETDSFRPSLGKARQSALIRQYKEQGGFVVTLYEDNRDGFKHLRRGAVVTAIVRTYMTSPDEAFNFWSTVRDGGGAKTCPSTQLRKYLLDQPETWDRKALYCKCITHYNAFVRGDKSVTWDLDPDAPLPVPVKA